MNYDDLDNEKIEDICNKVNLDSDKIQEIVNGIITPYCKDLDKYVDFIREILADGFKEKDYLLNIQEICNSFFCYIIIYYNSERKSKCICHEYRIYDRGSFRANY